MKNSGRSNNSQNTWPALAFLLLHTVCCIGIILFLLLGGAGLLALLASKGFWATAIGVLIGSIAGYWYYQQNQYRSCKSSNTNKRDQSAKIHTN
jgi:membrane protein implicated in regulation of membrane protease activity